MKYKAALALVMGVMGLQATSVFAATQDDALMDAIHAGDLVKVERVVQSGAKLNTLLSDGSTPLMWAVENQNSELVRLLLAKGAKPDVDTSRSHSNVSSFTSLTIACERGDADIVMALIDAGANIHAETRDGTSALSLCSAHSLTPVVEALIDAGADVNGVNAVGQSPLMWAASKAQLGTMQLLVARGADINAVTSRGSSPIFFALQSKNPDAPKWLAKNGASLTQIGPENTSVLQMAMYQKQFAFAAQLIEQGADLAAFDRNGHQLLHAAILNEQPELVAQLLRKGAEVNALTEQSKVVWRYEVNYTSRPYEWSQKSPLMLAVEKGNIEVISLLVEAGARVDFQTDKGMNIVHAAMATRAEVVDAVLSIFSQVNIQDHAGRTPLHYLMGYITFMPFSDATIVEMFQVLKNRGARWDIADKNGKTPWDLANIEDFKAKAEFIAIFKPEKR